jgi:glycosyltransferase involved in cell wall biosynthesis
MTVLFLANTGWYLNNFRRKSIEAFLKEGHEVVLLCPEGSGEKLLLDLSCEVRTFKLDNAGTNPFSEAKSLTQIFFSIRHLRPDIVFSFNPKTNLYGLLSCRLLGIPCVPNVSGVGNASQLTGWKALIYRRVSRFAYKSASHVFFQNESDMGSYQDLGVLRAGHFSCLPGSGVDLVRFNPGSQVAAKETFIFLMACRLIVQKGVMEYLQAAERLLASGANCEFWLAGVPDGTKRAVPEDVLREFEQRGVIRFLGNVSDMENVLVKVDCVVLPSWYPEGVPRVLLEGAAAGLPLITTNRPGCQDVVVEKKNGFFVKEQSVDSLVEAMENLISLSENELKALGLASRRLAEDRFDEGIVITEYLSQAASSV